MCPSGREKFLTPEDKRSIPQIIQDPLKKKKKKVTENGGLSENKQTKI